MKLGFEWNRNSCRNTTQVTLLLLDFLIFKWIHFPCNIKILLEFYFILQINNFICFMETNFFYVLRKPKFLIKTILFYDSLSKRQRTRNRNVIFSNFQTCWLMWRTFWVNFIERLIQYNCTQSFSFFFCCILCCILARIYFFTLRMICKIKTRKIFKQYTNVNLWKCTHSKFFNCRRVLGHVCCQLMWNSSLIIQITEYQ